MAELSRYPGRFIFFVDDHFAVSKKRTDALLDMIIDADLGQSLSAQTRIEVTKHPELVAKMKRANLHTVYVGFESVNPAALVELNKKQSVEDIERAIKVFHEHGMYVHGMFMFGADSDTLDVFKATTDFCREHRIDYAQYMILTPLPGTRTYAQLESEKRLLHKDWELYDALHAVFVPKNMTAEQLQQGMIDSYGNFYSYANGVKGMVRDSLINATILVRRLYSQAHFRSVHPAFMKFAGKKILDTWVKYNQAYLHYLREVSQKRCLSPS